MNTVELRKEVINSLSNVDERFLRMVQALYKSYSQNNNDLTSFEDLPIEIQEILIQSKNSIKESFFSHKEVINESKRKYNIS